jgi:hypothetical protein
MDLNNPAINRWQDSGVECWGVTGEYKSELIADYAVRYGLKNFIETGTWHGDTLAAVRPYFHHLHSIELSPKLHEQNLARFHGAENVHLYCGDSGEVLKALLGRMELCPTLFWLDAHPSGGDTVGTESPLGKELAAIFESGFGGVILVDDLQGCWEHNWAEVLKNAVDSRSGWQLEIKHGIGRVTHES